MPEEQKFIYYVCTSSVLQAENLPQAEQVRDHGYEILYMLDDEDEFVIRALKEHEGIPFCNITTDDLGFETEEDKTQTEKQEEENRELLDFVKETLGESVSDVKLSTKLKTHPVYLSTQGDVSIEMEKYFSVMKNNEMAQGIKAQRVLELNASHEAFKSLSEAFENDKERAKLLAKLLHSQALLIAGLPLENPSEYTELVCSLF